MLVTETFREAWARLEREIEATVPKPIKVADFVMVVRNDVPAGEVRFVDANNGVTVGKIVNLADHRARRS